MKYTYIPTGVKRELVRSYQQSSTNNAISMFILGTILSDICYTYLPQNSRVTSGFMSHIGRKEIITRTSRRSAICSYYSERNTLSLKISFHSRNFLEQNIWKQYSEPFRVMCENIIMHSLNPQQQANRSKSKISIFVDLRGKKKKKET